MRTPPHLDVLLRLGGSLRMHFFCLLQFSTVCYVGVGQLVFDTLSCCVNAWSAQFESDARVSLAASRKYYCPKSIERNHEEHRNNHPKNRNRTQHFLHVKNTWFKIDLRFILKSSQKWLQNDFGGPSGQRKLTYAFFCNFGSPRSSNMEPKKHRQIINRFGRFFPRNTEDDSLIRSFAFEPSGRPCTMKVELKCAKVCNN